MGSLNLLQAAQLNGCKNIIFSSTCAVYGDQPREPLSEDAPLNPSNAYAAMPRIAALPFYAIRLPERIARFAPCSPRAGRNARGFYGSFWTFNIICTFQKKL